MRSLKIALFSAVAFAVAAPAFAASAPTTQPAAAVAKPVEMKSDAKTSAAGTKDQSANPAETAKPAAVAKVKKHHHKAHNASTKVMGKTAPTSSVKS